MGTGQGDTLRSYDTSDGKLTGIEDISSKSSAINARALSATALTVVYDGCAPGYWKQPHHSDSWISYLPGESIEDPYYVPGSLELIQPEQGLAKELTLLEVLELRGR